MYTVITVILNANGFAIGSVVSLRQSQCNRRKSRFREQVTVTSEHAIIHQVFLILKIMLHFLFFSELMCGIWEILCWQESN